MKFEKYEDGIRNTGFHLEHKVCSELEKSGWTVIHSKYYVDDSSDIVREIDAIAYKTIDIDGLRIYTCLIVSCKKSKERAWGLLARNRPEIDPNEDWNPCHVWTSSPVVGYMLAQPEWTGEYATELMENVDTEFFGCPDQRVFAFQEMERNSGKPKNDKAIFNSITSLMKAQAYEMARLPERRKEPALYQFNLLSVADTDLVRIDFEGDNIRARNVDSQCLIASYIISKRETRSRIHFTTYGALKKTLEVFDRLHERNLSFFDRQKLKFFEGIQFDHKRLTVFEKDVARELRWGLWDNVPKEYREQFNVENSYLTWRSSTETLLVIVDICQEVVDALNTSEDAREKLSSVLRKYYRYTGLSAFDIDDIPF